MTDILVVAAHPDDELLGCGATLARLAAEGAAVHIVILGEGAASRRSEDTAAQIAALRNGARKAAATIGALAPTFFDFPDNEFDTVSLLEITQRKLPIYPISRMLKENFDNTESLGYFRGQLMVIAGTLDLVVPPSFSEQLFESAPTMNKSLVVVEDAGHVDDIYTFSQTKEAVQHFLAE